MTKTDEIIKKIADKFIEKINQFEGHWEKPFFSCSALPRNVITKKPYRGLNTMLLWVAAEEKNFSSNLWGTFDQWKEKGKSIKKGENGVGIIFWKKTHYNEEVVNENGETTIEEHEGCIARYYVVFNACQMTEYAPEEIETIPEDIRQEIDDFKTNFLDKTGIKYTETNEGRAFYIPSTDEVVLPKLEIYSKKSEYIPTACHEFTHATGAKTRLNRDFSGKFGDAAYAFEELIADIGAGMLSAALGKNYIFQNNNIAYLKSWIEILQDQPKAILKACSHAQKAADYLLELAEIPANAIENINI